MKKYRRPMLLECAAYFARAGRLYYLELMNREPYKNLSQNLHNTLTEKTPLRVRNVATDYQSQGPPTQNCETAMRSRWLC